MTDLLNPESAVPEQGVVSVSQEALSNVESSSLEADRPALEKAEQNEFLEQPGEELAAASAGQAGVGAAAEKPAPIKDEVTISVEQALEEKLGEVYADLPDQLKPAFRIKGEKISFEIAEMVRALKVNAQRVLHLIKEWLQMIPKANKFYLEQEAKIKTDKIILLASARKDEIAQKS